MARRYEISGYDKVAKVMRQCGQVITGGRCEDCGELGSVRMSYTCKQRLCPICMMRRSRVVAAQGLQAMAWMRENVDKPYSMHMVTLTQQNVCKGELGGEVNALLNDLHRMRLLSAVRRGVIGSARTIEVTCNPKQREGLVWHPHVHLIILLSGYPELAMADWWRRMWYGLRGLQDRQRLEDTQVEVHELTDDGAVYEVSKYVAKLTELLNGLTDEEAAPFVKELDQAIRGRYLNVWTGEWRRARRELNLKEPEKMRSDELDEVEEVCPECGGRLVDALMRWNGMEYVPMKGGAAK